MTQPSVMLDANKQWMTRPADERYTNLSDMICALGKRRNNSRAFDVPLPELRAEATDAGAIVINSGIQPSRPSHWAFGQMSQIIGAPASYLRQLPAPLAAQCINASLDREAGNREAMKVMTLLDDDGDYNTMQAVTSRTYGRIWDADVAAATDRIVERSNGKFFNPKDWSGTPSGLYASDHDVFIFMIDGGSMVDGGSERDQLHRGFIVSNSETGARTFTLMTFLFRVVCGNHMIWGPKDVNKLIVRHTSGGPGRFDREAYPALLEYANASAAPAEAAIRRAKEKRLIDIIPLQGSTVEADPLNPQWIGLFAKTHGFTRGEVMSGIQFAKAEEGGCRSLWDMINGLTASARSIEFVDARVNLETRAGKLMSLVE